MHSRMLLLTILAVFTADLVYAASNGSKGNTSTGTIQILIAKGNAVKISNLDDIDLGYWTSGAVQDRTETLCVYSSTGTYRITASSSNPSGTTFRLKSGSAYIPYSFSWKDTVGGGGFTTLSHNVVVSGQAGRKTNDNCSTGDNATIRIRIATNDIKTAASGSYRDRVTLLVAPD
jgi:spore coat protein U-like protein